MRVDDFVHALDCGFFTGVPDSQLKPLCDYLCAQFSNSGQHIIAANEGNSVALATGYYLATGKPAVVYLQNSGIGNIINPVTSLTSMDVYRIPCLYVVGWRGEPGVPDEPQHAMMGKVSLNLLKDVDISTWVIGPNTSKEEFFEIISEGKHLLSEGKSVAFLVRKNTFENLASIAYQNAYCINREDAIRQIAKTAGGDMLISTTGKISRELFDVREENGSSHSQDFLTVGSMGHCSSIALGLALQMPMRRVWCLDGDGAALMHMGAMAVIGTSETKNIIHILLNNEAHETVGGMPTVAGKVDFCAIARACGYSSVKKVTKLSAMENVLSEAKQQSGSCFVEIQVALGARRDLGRPNQTPEECKTHFMNG